MEFSFPEKKKKKKKITKRKIKSIQEARFIKCKAKCFIANIYSVVA
jgi:hypothetical protein